MAGGGRPATPSSSRTTRSAAAKSKSSSSTAGEASASTPTRKQLKAASALASIKQLKGTASTIHSPASPLHPPLPRPPSWQQSLASQFEHTSPRRRRRRTSNDERDPGDSVNSTEDELEMDDVDSTFSGLRSPSSARLGAASKNNNNNINNISKNTPRMASTAEKQNICVCVRIRPSAPGAAEQEAPIWELDEKAGRISLSENHPIMEKRKTVSDDVYDFSFDSLLLPPNPTSTMYEGHIRPVVSAALEGYNGTIFSYGQTGSGKTHTMTGSDEEPGILPLAISDIFQQITNDTERQYLLRVSYLEIYNETLKDLLEPVKTKNQELRLGEDKYGRVVVHNMKEEVVNSPQDVLKVLTTGEDNRSVNCTDWNQRSSRSHCVFSMIIESTPRDGSEAPDTSSIADQSRSSHSPDMSGVQTGSSRSPVRISQLNLIDLAGSERATSQEERRKEGAYINKSLLSLGNVIQKLAEGKNGTGHIPYRDSKLTRLLQTSLSGNARIAIVCTVSPEARHGTESVSTLKFAQRASKIITKAERGLVYDGGLIPKYEERIASLQAELARVLSSNTSNDLLESEKRARKEAEDKAEEHRLATIQLNDQIEHLKKQLLTGTAEASDSAGGLPRTPSMAKRHYGDVGTGSRPAGHRSSHRRLSELAFGIASPARNSGLPASSSMRSISSALETITTSSIPQDSDAVRRLEEELKVSREELQQEKEVAREEIGNLQKQIADLQSSEVFSKAQIEQCHTDNQRLQEERQASLAHAASLEQNLLELRKKEEEASRGYSDTLSILKKELENLRELVKQKDSAISNLKEAEAVKDRQITRLEEAEATSQLSASAAMEKVRRDLKALQAEHEAAIAAHATEKASLLERASAADGKLAECESVLKVKNAEISRLQEQVASDQQGAQKTQEELQKRIEEANAAVSRIQLQLTTLEREQALEVAEITAEYRQTNTELKNTLALAEASVEQHEKAATAQKDLVSKLQEQLACKEQALATLQDNFNLSQETVSELKEATKQSDQTVRSLTEAINDKDHAIASLREELDKKEQAEQARMKLAQLKAANAPPDFGALQAKMQAVSSRYTSKSLSNSLGSSDSDRMSLTLKAELEASQGKLRETEKTVDSQSRLLRQYEERIAELEADIARFRQQINKNEKLLRDLQSGELANELQALSIAAASPEVKPAAVAKNTLPLGALSPHRSAVSNGASYRSSGLSTPTKKDSHGYTWNAKPDPLPLPPGTPEWRKQRRQTTEHELQLLRTGGFAARSKSILQSPKLERPTLDWSSHSGMGTAESSPKRVKKSSAGSIVSRY